MDLKNYATTRICAAVSGGVDSVCLLHYLKGKEKEYGYSLSAVHCEHGIRGEDSVKDAEFVAALCKEWDIPLYSFAEDCLLKAKNEKCSVETAARNFRRECFEELLVSACDYIATAHHKNDEAETVLFRIARGTLSGVKGMEEECGKLLRPFLTKTREQILSYAKEHDLSYREDATNADTRYARNKIRLEVLPKLEEAVEGAVGNIVRFSSLCGEDDEFLYSLAQNLIRSEGEEVTVLFSDKKPLFRRACLLAMKGLGVEKDYTSSHLSALFNLQNSERGAKLDLPFAVECEKKVKGICFRKKQEQIVEEKPLAKKFSLDGFDGGRYEVILSKTPLEGGRYGAILRIDADKLPADCVFRFRREGDEINRFGGGRKSLKKFFNERKTEVKEREYLPLIAQERGSEVYVVCGEEISEEVKVDENTENILYVITRKKKEK